ncbi:hypothetical protein AJ80_08537 [Polytolypa hystricis UAMH7299]|uniref:RWD domain-containing protein n=1 Tax=Polytolypa hystricis (strain UAMH7299) TaxID=1447883 RepID=A0A2B7WY79_POLH7|nr:hypothetical protein AJ80_08537 [Polytolypa hystricis UAMH7299]
MASPIIKNEELAEEIDTIKAIYGDSIINLTTNSSSQSQSNPEVLPVTTTIVLQIPEHSNLSFLIGFDNEYPGTPPRVLGTASTSARGEGKKWVAILSDSVTTVWQPGYVCLYDVIVDAGERLEELRANDGEDASEEPDTATAPVDTEQTSVPLHVTLGLDHPPEWALSDPITEKRSVFVGRAAKVTSRETAEKYVDHLLATEKKVATATHNIIAWRIKQKGPSGTETVVQDFDDDGETAAGGRMLHLMQLMDVWDVVVVVTRWYGGVKLGPDRFRLINHAARDALLNAGFGKPESVDSNDKGKKKGKK